MHLFIRVADLKDAEPINKLSIQLGYAATGEQIQTRLKEILSHHDNCVFVAVENENIVGWVHGFYSLRIESASFVEIGGLVVDKNYQRKGVGQMLVKKVIEWSQTKRVDKIRVRCNTIRKEAHIFYKAIGFLETKEQKIFDLNY